MQTQSMTVSVAYEDASTSDHLPSICNQLRRLDCDKILNLWNEE